MDRPVPPPVVPPHPPVEIDVFDDEYEYVLLQTVENPVAVHVQTVGRGECECCEGYEGVFEMHDGDVMGDGAVLV